MRSLSRERRKTLREREHVPPHSRARRSGAAVEADGEAIVHVADTFSEAISDANRFAQVRDPVGGGQGDPEY